MNFFARQAVAFNNDLKRSCGALLGIAHGVLADGELNDAEIDYLRRWLQENENLAACWPGNVLSQRIAEVLADGHISRDERDQLVQTLTQLIGGASSEPVPTNGGVSGLALDDVETISVAGASFLLTGDFAYGPRSRCERVVIDHGGLLLPSVSKKLNYLVVGGLGSAEWKHGSFGTKIERAMQLKQAGVPVRVVHEDVLMASVFSK